MDAIRRAIASATITFGPTDDVKWRDAYTPFYPEFPKDIQRLRDEIYGPGERNKLDVYVPASEKADKPVVVFIHGGGFFSGDKEWSEKVYANVGYYFAQQGIISVVANHQLVPHAKYPGGADDMRLVREWIYEHISAPKYGQGSVQNVFLFGHSSGGAHICMDLFAEGDPNRTPKDPLFPPVAGVILLDVPFWFDKNKPARARNLRHYWGSEDENLWGPKSALGLFQRIPDNSPVLDSRKLPIFVGSVEWEIPETTDAMVMFFNAYRARSKPTGTLPTVHVLKKHNHLTNILSIGTEDTAQADKIMEFINDCLASPSPPTV
ncbi:hypothetical protein OIDMADRAFT_100472 [Oidiodendron maius Zn]|uniref:BD-FAE-like domain-containing protein n=1 Tax=Oidiodendron maius (strain Zn) TaxID=913774 RepID=A0A0C3HL73_OIDMZ|nr:hypothetical protein OIDMADRAFT_100472 [Oidiodendron maius Zn]